jgi:hypothetical protein
MCFKVRPAIITSIPSHGKEVRAPQILTEDEDEHWDGVQDQPYRCEGQARDEAESEEEGQNHSNSGN